MQSPTPEPSRSRKKLIVGGVGATLLVLLALVLVGTFSGEKPADASAKNDDAYALSFDGEEFSGEGATEVPDTKPVVQRDSEEKYASACASCVKKHRLAEMPAASVTREVAKGAPSNAEVEKASKQQKKLNFASGDKVEVDDNGQAKPPIGAPDEVRAVIAAGNQIANFPYIWGGGHGSFQARGYDCSGSVSYALRGANLVSEPLVSGDFENWGEPGPGKWITVYANGGHVFMVVGGVRYDTSFRDGPYGTRWQTAKRPMGGFVVRHPAGL
jgi:cell wall-associated NlpC family hydrolase